MYVNDAISLVFRLLQNILSNSKYYEVQIKTKTT